MATTKLYTIEDVEQLGEDSFSALIEGELLEMSPVGGEHGEIGHVIQVELGGYVRHRRLGVLFTPDTGIIFRRAPDTLLSPDAAFVRHERLPRPRRQSGFIEVIPDLAIEINSPFDRQREIRRKIDVYLHAGVPMVWEVDPASRSVRVHRPGHDPVVIPDTGELDGGEIVPGFRMTVADLFDDAWLDDPDNSPAAR